MHGHAAPDISLSVIVPGLNEECNIRAAVGELLAALVRAGVDWEVIIVNDGSTDRTGEIARELAAREPRITVLDHPRPMGIGYSFKAGVGRATKAALTWLPADGENDPNELLKYLPLIEHVDIVIPFVINKRIRPLLRRFLSSVYLNIINASFGTRFNYTNGNIIYRKTIFDTVRPRSNGFLIHAECLVRAIKAGFTFAEVPVVLKKRYEGDSKAVLFKSLVSVCKEYVALLAEIQVGRRLRRQVEGGSAVE
ncbi:MAG: glycosyltransferase family 2 protein [Candidatus Aureabacteria bacterium]|nr:glycosyltransferase family 2 protein [Candidatus Auribacterota bacterium]